ncbi:MAG: Sec-independent protein translocase protein TatB [Campylobacterota bacterium]
MFGMGFAEILIIGVIAILFLGPDKLPETMIQIAKFFKSVKTTVASAKSSIEEELHLDEIKKEANSYKRQLNEATSDLGDLTGVEGLKDDMLEMKKEVSADADAPDEPSAPAAPQKPEVVTFAKKSKKLDVETTDDKDTKPSENA